MEKEIVHTGDAATTEPSLVQAVKLGNLVLFWDVSARRQARQLGSASRPRRP